MKTILQTFILIIILSNSISAQDLYRWDFPVEENGSQIRFPFAGGLNLPQYSKADFDNDGLEDLLIFDKMGDVLIPFRNKGGLGFQNYEYAPEFIAQIPETRHWMLLRDYNCDGIKDLFRANQIGGIEVMKGSIVAGKLAFTQVDFELRYPDPFNPGFDINIFVSNIDIPAIDDIDGDGDLDILTFNAAGGYVDFFSNQSIENGQGCTQLEYELVDNCWGKFYESGVQKSVTLDDTCSNSINKNANQKHAGSTLCTFDTNADGVKELALGDLFFDNLNMLTNGGTPTNAFIIAQDTIFPNYNVDVDMQLFPAAFFEDVNNDGLKDLIVAPNGKLISEDVSMDWWYKNDGTNDAVVFNLIKKDLYSGEMIDVGTGASPVYFDYNRDGLLDIVIGNQGYYDVTNPGNTISKLALYENIGTSSSPQYKLITRDFANIEQFAFKAVTPTFGDLDNDGDEDMLIGEENGALHYFENAGGTGIASFPLITVNFSGIDIGKFSTPDLFDIDGDGDLDLFVGERNSNINYFENIGNIVTPFYSSTENTDDFGMTESEIELDGFITGYSNPHLYKNASGQTQMVVGTEQGELIHFSNIDGNLTGTFNVVTRQYGNILEGERLTVSSADVNNDGELDFAIGNFRGGISIYSSSAPVTSIDEINHLERISIYPNPSNDFVTIDLKEINEDYTIKLFDINGQLVLEKESNSVQEVINIKSLSKGVYILNISTGNTQISKKIIKQ